MELINFENMWINNVYHKYHTVFKNSAFLIFYKEKKI